MSLNMTWSGLVCAAILLGGHGLRSAVAPSAPAAPPAQAGDAENAFPYAVIVDRNAFRLNPAPPPTPPPAPPAPDLPTVIFSGTRKKGSVQWAMFAVKTKDEKKQETTTYMSLTNGEALGPVELIKISPSGDEVEIKNSGTHVVLTMKDNGFERTTPPATRGPIMAGARTIVPGAPGIPLPGMPGQSGAQAAASQGGGINVGAGTGNFSGRGGGIKVGSSGNVAGAAPANTINNLALIQQNAAGSTSLFPQSSVPGNNTAIRTGGNLTLNNPLNNPTPPGSPGPTPIPIPTPSTAMPPNYTPPPTRGYTGPMPPVPGL